MIPFVEPPGPALRGGAQDGGGIKEDMNNDRALIDFCASCYLSPIRYVRAAFNWGGDGLAGQTGPDQWQSAMLECLEDRLRSGLPLGEAVRVAVASGHGVGKSTMVAWLILWAMSTRPDLAGVVTANTAAQLGGKTWRELSVWHRRAINRDWFKWTATKFYHADYPDTWFVSAVPWSKERPEAFAGLHGRHVLLVFDEASAIEDVIWETAEGAMTTAGAMWFAFGNPTRAGGRFRECFGSLRHRWQTRRVDSRDAKMANQAQIQEWIEDYGADSDFVRVRVKGEFPRASSNQLISAETVENAALRQADGSGWQQVPVLLGVDVARFGDDASAIAVRQGLKCHELTKYRGLDLMTFASVVAAAIDTWQPAAVFVDQTGLGAGVVDRLVQLGYRQVQGVDFGGSPSEKGRGVYYNRRSELWGEMARWLKNADIPPDRELMQDLAGPEYGFSGDRGQIQLEKKDEMKKRGLASPDCGDALALTFTRQDARRIRVSRGMVEKARGLPKGVRP